MTRDGCSLILAPLCGSLIGLLIVKSLGDSFPRIPQKETRDIPVTYLGVHKVDKDECIVNFDTDGNFKTTEARGVISKNLFNAGVSLQGKEGQTQKISEWRKLSGLENMDIIRVREH